MQCMVNSQRGVSSLPILIILAFLSISSISLVLYQRNELDVSQEMLAEKQLEDIDNSIVGYAFVAGRLPCQRDALLDDCDQQLPARVLGLSKVDTAQYSYEPNPATTLMVDKHKLALSSENLKISLSNYDNIDPLQMMDTQSGSNIKDKLLANLADYWIAFTTNTSFQPADFELSKRRYQYDGRQYQSLVNISQLSGDIKQAFISKFPPALSGTDASNVYDVDKEVFIGDTDFGKLIPYTWANNGQGGQVRDYVAELNNLVDKIELIEQEARQKDEYYYQLMTSDFPPVSQDSAMYPLVANPLQDWAGVDEVVAQTLKQKQQAYPVLNSQTTSATGYIGDVKRLAGAILTLRYARPQASDIANSLSVLLALQQELNLRAEESKGGQCPAYEPSEKVVSNNDYSSLSNDDLAAEFKKYSTEFDNTAAEWRSRLEDSLQGWPNIEFWSLVSKPTIRGFKSEGDNSTGFFYKTDVQQAIKSYQRQGSPSYPLPSSLGFAYEVSLLPSQGATNDPYTQEGLRQLLIDDNAPELTTLDEAFTSQSINVDRLDLDNIDDLLTYIGVIDRAVAQRKKVDRLLQSAWRAGAKEIETLGAKIDRAPSLATQDAIGALKNEFYEQNPEPAERDIDGDGIVDQAQPATFAASFPLPVIPVMELVDKNKKSVVMPHSLDTVHYDPFNPFAYLGVLKKTVWPFSAEEPDQGVTTPYIFPIEFGITDEGIQRKMAWTLSQFYFGTDDNFKEYYKKSGWYSFYGEKQWKSFYSRYIPPNWFFMGNTLGEEVKPWTYTTSFIQNLIDPDANLLYPQIWPRNGLKTVNLTDPYKSRYYIDGKVDKRPPFDFNQQVNSVDLWTIDNVNSWYEKRNPYIYDKRYKRSSETDRDQRAREAGSRVFLCSLAYGVIKDKAYAKIPLAGSVKSGNEITVPQGPSLESSEVGITEFKWYNDDDTAYAMERYSINVPYIQVPLKVSESLLPLLMVEYSEQQTKKGKTVKKDSSGMQTTNLDDVSTMSTTVEGESFYDKAFLSITDFEFELSTIKSLYGTKQNRDLERVFTDEYKEDPDPDDPDDELYYTLPLQGNDPEAHYKDYLQTCESQLAVYEWMLWEGRKQQIFSVLWKSFAGDFKTIAPEDAVVSGDKQEVFSDQPRIMDKKFTGNNDYERLQQKNDIQQWEYPYAWNANIINPQLSYYRWVLSKLQLTDVPLWPEDGADEVCSDLADGNPSPFITLPDDVLASLVSKAESNGIDFKNGCRINARIAISNYKSCLEVEQNGGIYNANDERSNAINNDFMCLSGSKVANPKIDYKKMVIKLSEEDAPGLTEKQRTSKIRSPMSLECKTFLRTNTINNPRYTGSDEQSKKELAIFKSGCESAVPSSAIAYFINDAMKEDVAEAPSQIKDNSAFIGLSDLCTDLESIGNNESTSDISAYTLTGDVSDQYKARPLSLRLGCPAYDYNQRNYARMVEVVNEHYNYIDGLIEETAREKDTASWNMGSTTADSVINILESVKELSDTIINLSKCIGSLGTLPQTCAAVPVKMMSTVSFVVKTGFSISDIVYDGLNLDSAIQAHETALALQNTNLPQSSNHPQYPHLDVLLRESILMERRSGVIALEQINDSQSP